MRCHPGYGFLSRELRRWRGAVPKRGIVFIGPSPEALRFVRRTKGRAQGRLAKAMSGVPIIDGTEGADQPRRPSGPSSRHQGDRPPP